MTDFFVFTPSLRYDGAMVTDILIRHIAETLSELALPDGEIELEHPAELTHGDYATNIALKHAAARDESPRELAEQIADELKDNLPEQIARVSVAGPGFINFYLSKSFFADRVAHIRQAGDDFGRNKSGAGRTVIVEYSSPNIAKPFTVGHLRSTIIGDAIANILAFSGYEVIRDNHLGDWGTQFGKLIVALRKWGDIEAIKESEEPIKELVDLYVRFHKEAEDNEALEAQARAAFTALESGEADATRLWKVCRQLSLEEFGSTYRRLGISFDTMYGESFFADKTDAVIELLQAEGVVQESEGALLVFFDDDTLPPLMVRKQDGSTLYATRDLATDMFRKDEYGDDILIINEVGSEQTLYFKQLYRTEEMIGLFEKNQRFHVAHGLFRFADGKMSTREGNVIWLEDILDEAVTRAKEFNEGVAEPVGIGAVKYNDLKREAITDITFDWDEVLNLEGNSGPYLQYTYARTQSVLQKAAAEGLTPSVDSLPTETTDIERLVYRFPEVVERSADQCAPHFICTYLHQLAQAFNTFYAHRPIIDSDESAYRLALTSAVGQVLKNGLNLLGIETVESM